MKSFSDDLPNANKTVTQEEFTKFHADLGNVFKNVRLWLFGLAAANAILTIVLVFALHH